MPLYTLNSLIFSSGAPLMCFGQESEGCGR